MANPVYLFASTFYISIFVIVAAFVQILGGLTITGGCLIKISKLIWCLPILPSLTSLLYAPCAAATMPNIVTTGAKSWLLCPEFHWYPLVSSFTVQQLTAAPEWPRLSPRPLTNVALDITFAVPLMRLPRPRPRPYPGSQYPPSPGVPSHSPAAEND